MGILEFIFIPGTIGLVILAVFLLLKIRKKFFRFFLIAVVIITFPLVSFLLYQYIDEHPGEAGDLEWADLCRVNAVHEIAAMAERYKEQTGAYPFAGSANVPVEVILSGDPLRGEERFPNPGTSGIVLDWRYFWEEINKVSQVSPRVPVDPPRTGAHAPNYIQYYTDHKNYFVAASLDHPTDNTRKVGQHYYKYEVGSIAIPEKKIRNFKEIPPDEIENVKSRLQSFKRECPAGCGPNYEICRADASDIPARPRADASDTYVRIDPRGNKIAGIEPSEQITGHELFCMKNGQIRTGPAALATILSYTYNENVDESIVADVLRQHGDREKYEKKKGFTLLDMKRYLKAIGYTGTGYRSEETVSYQKFQADNFEQFANTALFVVDIGGHRHVVVFRGYDEELVYLGDPKRGNICLSFDDFADGVFQNIIFAVEKAS